MTGGEFAGDAVQSDRLDATPRLESLTGLRWWAAFAVFAFHSPNFVPMPLLNGHPGYRIDGGITGLGFSGVTFFFVLSGFVLTWSHRPEESPFAFYWRRFARVWPMIPISTFLLFPVAHGAGAYPLTGLWETLTLQQAWHKDNFYAANTVTWSLSCEAFFYLLFPLIIRMVQRLGTRLLAVSAALTTIVVVTAPPLLGPTQAHAGTPLYRLPEFLLGIVTATAIRKGWRPPMGARAAMVAVAGAGFCIGWCFRAPPSPATHLPVLVLQHWIWQWPMTRAIVWNPVQVMDQILAPFFALCIAAVAARDIRGERSWLRSAPLVHLGRWSYSFYLTSLIVLLTARDIFGEQPQHSAVNPLLFLLALVVAIGFASFCYRYAERPAERWLKAFRLRWGKTPRPVVTNVPADGLSASQEAR